MFICQKLIVILDLSYEGVVWNITNRRKSTPNVNGKYWTPKLKSNCMSKAIMIEYRQFWYLRYTAVVSQPKSMVIHTLHFYTQALHYASSNDVAMALHTCTLNCSMTTLWCDPVNQIYRNRWQLFSVAHATFISSARITHWVSQQRCKLSLSSNWMTNPPSRNPKRGLQNF